MSNIEFFYPDFLWTPEYLAARLDDPIVKVVDVRPGERYAMGQALRDLCC